MARRKQRLIDPGEPQFRVVLTGGPMKYYNKRRVRNPLAKKPKYGYEPVSIDWYNKIVEAIPEARRKQGLSQMALANVLGTCQAGISQIETGKANPTVELLNRISKVLKLNLDVVIDLG